MKDSNQRITELTSKLDSAEAEIARLKDIIEQALKKGPDTPNIYAVLNKVNTEAVPLMDLDQLAWSQIKRAAERSPWIPPEYYMNDWVSDVCRFLSDPVIEQVCGFVQALEKPLPPPGDSPSYVEVSTEEELRKSYLKVSEVNSI